MSIEINLVWILLAAVYLVLGFGFSAWVVGLTGGDKRDYLTFTIFWPFILIGLGVFSAFTALSEWWGES